MAKMTQKAMKAAVDALPVAAEGRTYLCIGPFCWGKDANAARAIANAKRNYSKTYYPEFVFMLYECGVQTTVNGIDGGYTYQEADGAPKTVLSFNMPESKTA
jgi:hypothetical protein